MQITGDRITLRLLAPDDVTAAYVGWLQCPETTQFLESRWRAHTVEAIRDYVRAMNDSPADFLFGIFLNDSGAHTGNIKIGNVNVLHRFADMGLLIGKEHWGQGYATEAIGLATRYAFEELNLNKLIAGIYANNPGSLRAFLKAGWVEAGRLRGHRFYKGGYVDEILVEKLRDE